MIIILRRISLDPRMRTCSDKKKGTGSPTEEPTKESYYSTNLVTTTIAELGTNRIGLSTVGAVAT